MIKYKPSNIEKYSVTYEASPEGQDHCSSSSQELVRVPPVVVICPQGFPTETEICCKMGILVANYIQVIKNETTPVSKLCKLLTLNSEHLFLVVFRRNNEIFKSITKIILVQRYVECSIAGHVTCPANSKRADYSCSVRTLVAQLWHWLLSREICC